MTLESNAILVQLPLPDQIDESLLLSTIDPMKDPYGINPDTLSRLARQEFSFENDVLPCTPIDVINLINSALVELGKPTDLTGTNATVYGRSNLVGSPTALLLKKLGANVIVCHSKTSAKDRTEALKNANIVVSAVRKTGNLVGDVDFKAVSEVASAITPVPGGVGPMTLATLM